MAEEKKRTTAKALVTKREPALSAPIRGRVPAS